MRLKTVEGPVEETKEVRAALKARVNATKKKRSRSRKRRKATTVAPTSALPLAEAFPFNVLETRDNSEPPPASSGLVFRVGPRKDLENFVGPTLVRLGLKETKGMDWQVYVGLQFKTEYEKNYLLAPNGSLMSSMPGLKETLGDKEAFSRLWRQCLTRGLLELCSWTTPSYNLAHKIFENEFALAVEGGAEEFLKHIKEYGNLPSTYIVKPQRRYLSLGMHLAIFHFEDAKNVETFATWAKREVPAAEKKKKYHTKQPGEFTIQKYVERPALLGKRKFDLRLWVLIASLEPLSIYLLDKAFPKISVQDYKGQDLPLNNSTLNEKCMHILMMVPEFCRKKTAIPVYPYAYPGTTSSPSFFENLDLKQESSWRHWQRTLWPSLEQTILLPLLLARPSLREHDARIFGTFDNDASRRYDRFALLSPDAVYDTDAETWRLEEINTNGLFQIGSDDPGIKTFHKDQGYTEGWMHLVGATDFPNKIRYEASLQKHLDSFCSRVTCDKRERRQLERSAHQNAHVSNGWYRLYPPVNCEPHCGLRQYKDIRKNKLFNKFFEEDLSLLERKHFDFLDILDTAYFRSRRPTETSSSIFPDYII